MKTRDLSVKLGKTIDLLDSIGLEECRKMSSLEVARYDCMKKLENQRKKGPAPRSPMEELCRTRETMGKSLDVISMANPSPMVSKQVSIEEGVETKMPNLRRTESDQTRSTAGLTATSGMLGGSTKSPTGTVEDLKGPAPKFDKQSKDYDPERAERTTSRKEKSCPLFKIVFWSLVILLVSIVSAAGYFVYYLSTQERKTPDWLGLEDSTEFGVDSHKDLQQSVVPIGGMQVS